MGKITSLAEEWEGHSGAEVQEFIKEKLGTFGENVYNMTLQLRTPPPAMAKDADVELGVKVGSSVAYASGGQENIDEVAMVEIQYRTSLQAAWSSGDSLAVASNDAGWVTLPLHKILSTGVNYVRMRAVGEYAESVWRSFEIQVVNLTISPNMSSEVPQTGETLQLNYFIGGAVAKRMLLEFGDYDLEGQWLVMYSHERGDVGTIVDLGTEVNLQTGRTLEFSMSGLMDPGVHVVRAKLWVSESIQTDVVETQYMVVQEGVTPSMVAINDVVSQLDNYSEVEFFKWAAYGPDEQMPVVFRLVNNVGGGELARWEFNAQRGHLYPFRTQLALEVADSPIYAYMHIESANGAAITAPVFFTIGNSAEFSPVSGAEFVFSPSTRSNDEDEPQTVVNSVTGTPVASVWDGFDMVSDGYMEVAKDLNAAGQVEKVRALHVPAGRQLTIGFNPFRELANAQGSDTGLVGRSMTFEVDFRTSNILNEGEPVLRLCTSGSDGKPHGLEMRATEAMLLTAEKRVVDDQNVSWAEEVRTRLSVNVVYNLYGSGLNYVRMFVNDTIEREFTYTVRDRFVGGDVQMSIGAESADIDIFGMRCYQKALAASEVMQDYRSGLADTAAKIAWQTANDILGDGGTIDFNKAKNAGYNVLGHTGHLPKYGDENKGKTKGVSLYIGIAGEPERSGTLTHLTGSGQGTTAMTYWDWNQQYKVGDDTEWVGDNEESAGSGYGSAGYAIADGEALAKKLVGKINFASSQQGHKMGLTRAYTDVFKQLVRQNRMSQPGQMALQASARIAVLERPFLFFHRETENDPWEFRYLMTFGAGKGDKPTFGFNKSRTADMLMVEGADNDKPLALFAAPWNGDVVYDKDKEAWMYAGQKNLNFGFGVTTTDETGEWPSNETAIGMMKSFFNFVYLHNHSIVGYYDGTYNQLRNGVARAWDGSGDGLAVPQKGRLYWLTAADAIGGHEQYDLLRYDHAADEWVPAGVAKDTLNVRAQYEAMCADLGTSPATWNNGEWQKVNAAICSMRVAHFRAHAAEYLHVDDAMYHSCFVKLFAGTDNRAKNTYYYLDPATGKIRFMQDDLDTVLKTNNVGQNRKPYWVEEHDKNDGEEYYWQGERCGLYNLLEDAFGTEMTTMMQNMLGAMAVLEGDVMTFMERYILEAQDYFPAVAYNEMARLVYERASVAQSQGLYTNNAAQAITQSNGTQRWSEWQWLKDRVMYISSWCGYGEFAPGTESSGALSFRGTMGHYAFVLTPAKWLYPRVSQGSSHVAASAQTSRVRVRAGEAFAYREFDCDNDTTISIKGINYYLDLGDMNIPVSASSQTSFSFDGRKLQKIVVNATGEAVNLMKTQSVVIGSATNIKELTVRGVDTLGGTVDLSKCQRLQKIDMRGSGAASINLPGGTSLVEIHYPGSLTQLELENKPDLQMVELEDAGNLVSVVCTGTPADVAELVMGILERLNN